MDVWLVFNYSVKILGDVVIIHLALDNFFGVLFGTILSNRIRLPSSKESGPLITKDLEIRDLAFLNEVKTKKSTDSVKDVKDMLQTKNQMILVEDVGNNIIIGLVGNDEINGKDDNEKLENIMLKKEEIICIGAKRKVEEIIKYNFPNKKIHVLVCYDNQLEQKEISKLGDKNIRVGSLKELNVMSFKERVVINK